MPEEHSNELWDHVVQEHLGGWRDLPAARDAWGRRFADLLSAVNRLLGFAVARYCNIGADCWQPDLARRFSREEEREAAVALLHDVGADLVPNAVFSPETLSRLHDELTAWAYRLHPDQRNPFTSDGEICDQAALAEVMQWVRRGLELKARLATYRQQAEGAMHVGLAAGGGAAAGEKERLWRVAAAGLWEQVAAWEERRRTAPPPAGRWGSRFLELFDVLLRMQAHGLARVGNFAPAGRERVAAPSEFDAALTTLHDLGIDLVPAAPFNVDGLAKLHDDLTCWALAFAPAVAFSSDGALANPAALDELAKWIRGGLGLLMRLQAYWEQAQRMGAAGGDAIDLRAQPAPAVDDDGPLDGCRFRWAAGGLPQPVIDVEPKPWLLLRMLWDAPGRRANLEDAGRWIWREDWTPKKLEIAQWRANAALAAARCPLQIRKRAQVLYLE